MTCSVQREMQTILPCLVDDLHFPHMRSATHVDRGGRGGDHAVAFATQVVRVDFEADHPLFLLIDVLESRHRRDRLGQRHRSATMQQAERLMNLRADRHARHHTLAVGFDDVDLQRRQRVTTEVS